jgi:Protein of unknown function (DUF1826)
MTKMPRLGVRLVGLHAPMCPHLHFDHEPVRLVRTYAAFDYLLVESTGISEPLPVAEPRLGRRTVLTFPLLPPPQKN